MDKEISLMGSSSRRDTKRLSSSSGSSSAAKCSPPISSGDDLSHTWDCSVCTYRNSAEAFKCLMCDVRKGTSTRKPRINPEMVAQQVARQQEQIKQQAIKAVKTKTGEKRKDDDITPINSPSNSATVIQCVTEVKNQSISTTLNNINPETISHSFTDSIGSSLKDQSIINNNSNSISSCLISVNTNVINSNIKPIINTNSQMSSSSSTTNSLSPPIKIKKQKTIKNKSKSDKNNEHIKESNDKLVNCATTSSNTMTPTVKVKKPRTISAKAKLKNVDRSNAHVKEVTVNNVTVIITEFTPKSEKSSKKESKTNNNSNNNQNDKNEKISSPLKNSLINKTNKEDKKFSDKKDDKNCVQKFE